MTDTRAKGRWGEEIAAQALLSEGYEIICRNYRRALGEIDIIAAKNDCVYFVEVKAKSGESFGVPAESVNQAKRQQIAKVAGVYISEAEKETEYGFLVVSVILNKNKVEIIEDSLL